MSDDVSDELYEEYRRFIREQAHTPAYIIVLYGCVAFAMVFILYLEGYR